MGESTKKPSICKYRIEWQSNYKFFKLVVDEEREHMKFKWCKNYRAKGPRDRRKGYKNHSARRWCNENNIKMPKHNYVIRGKSKIGF